MSAFSFYLFHLPSHVVCKYGVFSSGGRVASVVSGGIVSDGRVSVIVNFIIFYFRKLIEYPKKLGLINNGA